MYRYHDCALDIAELYNELRYAKSYEVNDPNKKEIFRNISDKYDKILKRYENHRLIDYERFQLNKPGYFKLRWTDRQWIELKYYWKVYFKYHLIMYGLLILFLAVNLKKLDRWSIANLD